MKKKFAIYAVLMLFIAVSASCDNDNSPYVRIADRATFEKQRALWEESWNNNPRSLSGESWDYVNYQFTYSFFGSMGPDKVRVTVRENEDAIIECLLEGARGQILRIQSMGDVFDFLNIGFEDLETIKTNWSYVHKVIFDIEYCEQHHFPKRASFHVVHTRPGFVGGWWSLDVTDFKRLD